DEQLNFFKALQEGLAQRGKPLGAPAIAWGEDLAMQMFGVQSKDPKRVARFQQAAAEIAAALKSSKLQTPLRNLLQNNSADAAPRAAGGRAVTALEATAGV